MPEAIANQADFGAKLLQEFSDLSSVIDNLQPGSLKKQTKREFDECYLRLLSLFREHVLLGDSSQKPQNFPPLLPLLKLNQHYKPFDYDLPEWFISEATERIKLRKIKYLTKGHNLVEVIFVLWNGKTEIETSQFGSNNTNLQTYLI